MVELLDRVVELGGVVIGTSLAVPDGPVAAWADRHRAEWFRQDDLRVGVEAYAEALVPRGLLVRQARRLHRMMDGWVGPLALVAHGWSHSRQLSDSTLGRAAVERAARDLDPLIAALGPLAPGISLLPALSAPLLDEVLDAEHRSGWLRAMARFVPPEPGVDVSVRPHPVLRRILGQASPPGGDAHEIRERAMAWYLSRDHVADAIRVLIDDDRTDEALELIRQNQLMIAYHDGRDVQRRLMDEMPQTTWTPADHLLYAVACNADGDHRQSAYVLTSAPLQAPDLPAGIAIARDASIAYLGMLSHPPELCIAAGKRAVETIAKLPPDAVLPHAHIAENPIHYRACALTYAARSQILLGQWDLALDTLDDAGRCGHPLLDHAWAMFRAWAHGLRGDVSEAQRIATRALDAADFWPEIHVIAVEARLALCEVHLLQDRLDAARDLAQAAIRGAEARRSANQLACSLVALAEIELRSGQATEACAALDRVGDGAYGFVAERADAIRARALLATGEPYDASVLLQRLSLDQHTIVAHAEALAAGIGTGPTAEEIRTWEPPPWRSASQAHEDARAILDLAGSPSPRPAPPVAAPRPNPGRFAAADRAAAAHGLSIREGEILRTLLDVQALGELADQLGISRNTLKTHLQRIYRKLDVNSRDEAIDLVVRGELDPP